MSKDKDATNIMDALKRAGTVKRGEPEPAPPLVSGLAKGETLKPAREGRVNVGIRTSIHDLVREAAFRERTSVQEVVERALLDYFNRQ